MSVCERVLHMARSLYLSRLSVSLSLSLSPYRGRAVVASVPSICRRCLCVAFLRSTAGPNIYNNFFVNGNEGSKFLVVAHSLSLSLAVASPALTTDSFAQYVCNQLKLKPATNGHVWLFAAAEPSESHRTLSLPESTPLHSPSPCSLFILTALEQINDFCILDFKRPDIYPFVSVYVSVCARAHASNK